MKSDIDSFSAKNADSYNGSDNKKEPFVFSPNEIRRYNNRSPCSLTSSSKRRCLAVSSTFRSGIKDPSLRFLSSVFVQRFSVLGDVLFLMDFLN